MRRALRVVLAGAVVVSLALYGAYRSDISKASERIATGSEVVETRCGPIEYTTAGNGPAVLFVHGAGGGFDQGRDFIEPLVKSGLRVVLMSRFGYLRTPLPADASPAAQADAHACLLDALGIERAAALVLLVPAAYVPRAGGAASLETPPGTQLLFETALKSDFLFWAAVRFASGTVLRAILATPPQVVAQASADEQARVKRMMKLILPVSPRRLGLLNDAAVTSSLPRYELERIAAPTLVISVADDLFGTYEAARYTAEHIPRARFVGFPTGGHVWVGHHRQVISEIAAFLRR